MEEEDLFYEKLAKLEAFKLDLKSIFHKHKVTLKNDVEMWHGGRKDVIKVFIDGENWINDNFDEILEEMNIIK